MCYTKNGAPWCSFAEIPHFGKTSLLALMESVFSMGSLQLPLPMALIRMPPATRWFIYEDYAIGYISWSTYHALFFYGIFQGKLLGSPYTATFACPIPFILFYFIILYVRIKTLKILVFKFFIFLLRFFSSSKLQLLDVIF